MNQLLSIVDDKIVIEKLAVKFIDGNTTFMGHSSIKGSLSVVQTATFDANLKVRGTIEADTIKVKHLITEDASQLDAFTFSADREDQFDGKGLIWGLADNAAQYKLVFRSEPRRIYSSETLDIHRNARYQIDGMDVLTKDSLGSVIKKSNLTKLGVLELLEVDGNANLGNVVIVNSYLNRVGINTEKPNAALSVLDNGIEIAIGAEENRAFIGSWTNHRLDIVTDNTTRISLQGSTTIFGSEKSKNAVVKINGTLEVDSIVTDTRVERTAPIEFLEDTNTGIYGKGLAWRSKGNPVKQFFFVGGPDRFYSTESIDLADNRSFSINKTTVLNTTSLGVTVKDSNLETVGVLRGLTVAGDVNLNDALGVRNNEAYASHVINIASGDVVLSVNSRGITASEEFYVSVKDTKEVIVADTGIQIGNKDNTARIINAYGRLSVNITNPDPEAAFSVEGPVVMNGKKFVTGDGQPTYGNWQLGDIVWNSTPQSSSFIGWVCIASGTPGVWRPFGQIA
jgi:hypothetical protein